MGATAATTRSRQLSRQAEQLIKRQASTPVERAPDKLTKLNRSGNVYDAKPLSLTAKAPENARGLNEVAKVAQERKDASIFLGALPKAEQQALGVDVCDPDLHPKMLARLLEPLNRAGVRADAVAGRAYGSRVTVVVRIEREAAGVTWDEDIVVEGKLSDVRRALPDKMTLERWAKAGVDVSALAVPKRMEWA